MKTSKRGVQSLRTVHLYGALKKFSDEPFKIVVNDTRDLISALESRFGHEFRKHVIDHPEYSVVISDRYKKNPRPVYNEFINSKFGKGCEVHLIPAASGAGIEAALITWGFSAAAASVIATVIINVAVSVVLGAIAKAFAPKPETGNSSERPEERPSYLYNGPENVTEAGFQEPVVYGSHMTGSVVVSAGITVEQLPYDSVRQAPPPGATSPTAPPALPWQWTGA